jgi:5-methylcytosine-specific restriction protein A
MPRSAYHNTQAWKALRQAALWRDGYRCAVPGCKQKATHVDHVVSRRQGGADELENLRCLCAQHDNQVKEDATGKRRSGGKAYIVGCDASGRPLDPAHWWNEKISQS